MFIFHSKRLFSQGIVLQFWSILLSYGEKSGIWVSYHRPWLGLLSEILRRTFSKKVDTNVEKRKSCLRIILQ